MSKKFKKFFAGLLAFVMAFAMTAAAAPAAEVKADEDGYLLYLAIGAGNDWELCYDNAASNGAGEFTADNGIIATQEMISVGETATVSLVMPSEVAKTWYLAPVLVAEGIKYLDYTVNAITIDGEDVLADVNLNARADGNWWYEGTGPYTETQAIRLAGGYNEWGDKFMAEGPAGWTELSFTITLNDISTEEKLPEYETFLAIGAGNDWDLCWANEAENASGIVGTVEKVSVGETVTVSLVMPREVEKTWYLAPVLVAEGIKQLDYTVNSITIDGEEVLGNVNLDARADGNWWYEATGPYTDTQSMRLAGGYNEWGDKFMAEGPTGWTELTYTYTLNSLSTEAAANVTAVELPEEIDAFIAIGAENVAGAWDMCWANEADNASGIVGTVEKVSVGETVTLKLAMPNEVTKTYYFAPTLVVNGVGALDATITSMKFDGEEFIQEVDFSLNPDRGSWWYEGTGAYTAEEAVRLAGGYNEWADKYLAEVPTGWTELEITFTLNSIAPVAPTVSNEIVYTGDVTMFLAGTAESADQAWDWTFANGTTDNAALTGTVATAKAGETVTIGVTYPSPVHHTWWLAPTLVLPEAEDGLDKYLVDYTIDKVTIDGTDVTDKLDLTLGEKASWYEGTEDYPVTRAIRLKGGYNEWGDHYIPGDLLAGHTNIEYTITINKIYGVVVEEVEGPKVDKNGTYNAYIGIQTADSWAFRNAWDDATYGKDSTENPDAFNQLSIAETDLGLVKKNATITDTAITGNGTYTVSIKDFDFVNAAGTAATDLNLLFVSTDIPNSGEITVSNAVVKFDGKVVMEVEDCVLNPDSKEWMNVMFINIWNKEITAAYPMADVIPAQSVEITFDVSGFDYDNTAAVEPTPEPTPEPTAAPTEAPVEPTTAPTEAPVEPTAAPTEAPADIETDAEGGMSPVVIAVIVVVVLAVAAGAAFVVMKKKK